MTERSFEQLCQHHIKQAKRENSGWAWQRSGTWCVNGCSGRPAELTILTEEEMMGVIKQCVGCKRKLTIRGKGLCAKCFNEQQDLPLHGGERLPDMVVEAMTILQADRDIETLTDACRRRMDTMLLMDKLCSEKDEQIKALQRELDEMEQRAIDELPYVGDDDPIIDKIRKLVGVTSYGEMDGLIADVMAELTLAKDIYPDWPNDIIHQTAIMIEEAGEAMQAANDCVHNDIGFGGYTKLRNELVQTAAMCFRCLGSLP